MQIRIFTIRALGADERAVEDLNAFLRSHRVANVDRQFVADGANSYWSVYVTFVDGRASTYPDKPKKRIDYREVLNEHDFAIFARLRTLRKTLAEHEGVPAYALFTNEQLAEMVRRNVDSKKTLSEISGVGEARVEKYGDAFLSALKEATSESSKGTQSNAETQSGNA